MKARWFDGWGAMVVAVAAALAALEVGCTAPFEVASRGGADGPEADAADEGFDLGQQNDGSDATATAPVDGGRSDARAGEAAAPPGDAMARDSQGETSTAEASGGCAAGTLECHGACVPSDTTNCGACGHSCTSLPNVSGATTCSPSGACVFASSSCAPGWSDCDGQPDDGCETNITLPASCGSCNGACTSSDPVCAPSGGSYACASGCGSETLCSGSCVDTMSSPGNCHTCGNQCPGISGGQATCNGGTCGVACNGSLTACPTASPTACVDTGSDLGNCGGCGIACTTAVPDAFPTCASSQCGFACDENYVRCGGQCVPAADTVNGAFVAPGASGACTAASPCGSIGQAAALGKSVVYVAPGSYSEVVTVPGGVRITGGWTSSGGVWSSCGATASSTVVSAPAGQTSVVESAGAGASLDTLTLENLGPAGPGETLYGVMATGGSLTLSDVSIQVAAGGAGVAGASSAAGAAPAAAGQCTAGNGASGGPGAAVTSSSAGSYSATGYTPGTGASGGDGTGASGGAAGPAVGASGGPTCVAPVPCCTSATAGCVACVPVKTSCGQVGLPGCPSGASLGGRGGTGGGSSIGVFAWGAVVTVGPGSIATGNGGVGGTGGAAGAVVAGGLPAAGAAGGSVPSKCTAVKSGPTETCGLDTTGPGGLGGAEGTAGGTGGQGAAGGGGSGGDSFCCYAGGGATVSSSASCSAGQGGAAGNAGAAGQGVAGSAGAHN